MEDLNLSIGSQNIPVVRTVKNLGVIFDDVLKFKPHISEICRRTYICYKQISHLKNDLPNNIKLLLVESLILSHLNYGDIVFGPCLNVEEKEKLQKIQNMCIRFASNTPFFNHITPVIRDLGLLKIHERRFLHYFCFVRKMLDSHIPEYLINRLLRRDEVHQRAGLALY